MSSGQHAAAPFPPGKILYVVGYLLPLEPRSQIGVYHDDLTRPAFGLPDAKQMVTCCLAVFTAGDGQHQVADIFSPGCVWNEFEAIGCNN